MIVTLLISTLLFLLCLGEGFAEANEVTVQFDDGTASRTTVVGYFMDNTGWYHEAVDFSFNSLEFIEDIRVLVHVHVGSEIEPLLGEESCQIAIRVNDGPWHPKALDGLMDDRNHWMDFPVPVSEWRVGLNRVTTTSTVANRGNMTSQSLDLLGSTSAQPSQRSYYSQNLQTYRLSNDRNWGIRLKYKVENPEQANIASVEIIPPTDEIVVNQSNQFYLTCKDAEGKTIPCNEAIWSSTGGIFDQWGLLTPFNEGIHVIKARVGAVTAEAKIEVVREYPLGIEPPVSPERLGPQIPEGHLDLCGKWEFTLDPSDRGVDEEWFLRKPEEPWGSIYVPGCWQAQGWGLFNHSVGWYKREFNLPKSWNGNRVHIRFGAVSTHATVWINGEKIGEHLGNWTPFGFDVTESLQKDAVNELVVRVEERENYFGAGFPRVVGQFAECDSHFGGIWQEVSLFQTGDVYIEDLHVSPSLKNSSVDVSVRVTKSNRKKSTVEIAIYNPDGQMLIDKSISLDQEDVAKVTLGIAEPKPWSPQYPNLYTAVVSAVDSEGRKDTRKACFGMRDVERQGSKILLNDQPIIVRGVLHWGYYPELFTIDPSEERIRREFEDLKRAGFNLVKVCLFMFPKRFYEIADEVGMLIWQEYPTWHTIPQEGFTGDASGMVREFAEWIRFDRNHPSVILRDLTCESPKPEKGFISDVYSMCKEMTDGALVEDNSNNLDQVFTDWYDAHAYRDLDDFILYYFPWLSQVMREKQERKPFLSGEDFDFDTYRDVRAVREAFQQEEKLPWWLDNANFYNQERFDKELEKTAPGIVERLVKAQKERGLFYRKTVWEAFRSHPELTGYVMTCIRDIPATRPGFYDDLMEPKWTAEQWRPFNTDRVLLLDTGRVSHCFWDDETFSIQLMLSNFGGDIDNGTLVWKIAKGDEILEKGDASVYVPAGEISELCSRDIDSSQFLQPVREPVQLSLEAQLKLTDKTVTNQWDFWIFPKVKGSQAEILVHSANDSKALADELGLEDASIADPTSSVDGLVLVSDSLDDLTIGFLERGGRVLYLGPRADRPSLPYHNYKTFWRETAIPILEDTPFWGDFPHGDYVGRQFMLMSQRQPFNCEGFTEDISPLLQGLNARDPGLNTVYYLFETRVLKGAMLGCCLVLDNAEPVAGHYLLRNLVDYISSEQFTPSKTLPVEKLIKLVQRP